ncbi:hypothetical protein M2132_001356 [Dysgonomonas sp. PH5-45]|uniref:DUF5715 family protein n=1 Tax=unclassified Dysgonomonas TaxID=2630389 RepID=UPI002476A999|nr:MULTISPECIES: DUF5715 family protein [unclassified Dysgonomonas]MDH6355019.1 hypothetical protein [Dysgonomonas sp. PH5-45]MDH6387919.1 hypothetical protein [Dysgonomonas sp. PH5-37]
MKYSPLSFCLIFIIWVAILSCKSEPKTLPQENTPRKHTRFNGNYNKTFSDLHDLHTSAALAKGISVLESRADTALCKDKLVRIPCEIELYRLDELKHSIPYLVPDASALLTKISANFRDSLINQKLTLYKPIVTSITRTDEDVKTLTKRNRNASDNSAHRYATTFDISWRRFAKVQNSGKDLSPDKLKLVLGQVLHDLREGDECYIKHERKQACFHITVR